METRQFGHTQQKLPFLGLGCQRLVDTSNCPEPQALQILERAFERGIRYFDTAPVYGLGQSEQRLGRLAVAHRPEMWLATKTTERSCAGALRQLEDSLARLQTGYVDEWRIHNVVTLSDLEQCFQPGGVIEAVLQAKQQGLVRYASISVHTHPQVLIEAMRRFSFDSIMFPASVLDRFINSFEDDCLPLANARGLATVGMKALALGRLSHVQDKALRYCLDLPVSMVLVGCSKLEELEQDLQVAEEFIPLDDQEQQALFQQVQPLVTPKNIPWKAVDWGTAGEWIQHG